MSELSDLRRSVEDGFNRIHDRLDAQQKSCVACMSQVAVHKEQIAALQKAPVRNGGVPVKVVMALIAVIAAMVAIWKVYAAK